MTVIHIAIGNSDDKLTQRRWSDFCRYVAQVVAVHSTEIHGEWQSAPDSRYQNACWAFEADARGVRGLRLALARLAKEFDQDSIAWTEGETEFIKAR